MHEGHALGNLGLALYNSGEVRRSIPYEETWLSIARDLGNVRDQARALNNLGNAYYSLGHYQ
jgi:hypothetical protein